jgi:ubiquinone/menaquinone biosynthesis C-methylase UbiE
MANRTNARDFGGTPELERMMWEHHHYRFGLAGEGQADIIERVLDRAPSRLLNVGIGAFGDKVAQLSRHCRFQVALDIQPEAIALVRPSCDAGNVVFVNGDARSLAFAADCFDHVVALGLFAYIDDPLLVFREFMRVCRPGGRVMITNSVSRPKTAHVLAGQEAGLELLEAPEGYCPAASGNVKSRYLLVFAKPAARCVT